MTDKKKVKKGAFIQNSTDEKVATDAKTDKNNDSDKVDTIRSDNQIKEMEDELEAAKQEAKEAYDRFLRVSAEFENYKKRSAREMNEFRKYANESFIKAMLPVVDNLERAINLLSNNESVNNSVIDGVDMTHKEMLKVLETFGTKSIESLEKLFDPSFHQAVMQEEAEDVEENTVLKELQKGYLIHDRLLRPAMVVVSKAKATSDEEKMTKN
ncbi:MAG: nucleotide exchange factor GrpE [Deltaproteobacteria bacterium CG1_02_45_11]|nr:MAG: nucleotide exchange factor GrpE [Deltaproteobacteria bacterium CG1_02_45_11]